MFIFFWVVSEVHALLLLHLIALILLEESQHWVVLVLTERDGECILMHRRERLCLYLLPFDFLVELQLCL